MNAFLLILMSFSSYAFETLVQNHTLFTQPQNQDLGSLLKNEIRLQSSQGLSLLDLKVSQGFNLSSPDAPTLAFEKGKLETKFGNSFLTVGDSHQILGRGLTLALYEDATLGIDHTLLGVNLSHEHKTLPLQIAAGKIHSLSQPVNLYPVSNPLSSREVYLGTAQATFQTENIQIGLKGMFAQDKDLISKSISKNTKSLGAHFETSDLFSGLNLYYENKFGFTDLTSSTQRFSYPLSQSHYGHLSFSNTDYRLQLEGKFYKGELFEFVRPPTLEEDVIETDTLEDSKGLRLKAEKLWQDWKLGSSVLVEETGNLQRQTALHPVVFLNSSSSKVGVGYRMTAKDRLIHGAGYQKLPIDSKNYFEINLRKITSSERDQNGVEVSYTLGNWLSLSLGYDFLPREEFSDQHKGHLSVKYQQKDLTLKGLFGSLSGGTQCSSGVCRVVPKFDGFYVESFLSL